MSKVKVLKEMGVSPSGAEACLVEKEGQYYLVSSVVAPFSGFETLVFPADKKGRVMDWVEVAGGRGVDRESAIIELENLDREIIDVEVVSEEDVPRELNP